MRTVIHYISKMFHFWIALMEAFKPRTAKNTAQSLQAINAAVLISIGLFCFLYSLFVSDFAELNISFFLPFPIFVGELLLMFCVILLIAKLRLTSSWGRWHSWALLGIYMSWVVGKALLGYGEGGALAFRNAALFYYPLFAVIGFHFYDADILRQPKILGAVYVLLAGTALSGLVNDYCMITYIALLTVIAMTFRQSTLRFLGLGFVLIYVIGSRFIFVGSRTHLLGCMAALVCLLIIGINLIPRKNKWWKPLIITVCLAAMALGFARFSDKNAIISLTKPAGIISLFKEYQADIEVREKDFVARDLPPKVYHKNEWRMSRGMWLFEQLQPDQALPLPLPEVEQAPAASLMWSASTVELSSLSVSNPSKQRETFFQKETEVLKKEKAVLPPEKTVVSSKSKVPKGAQASAAISMQSEPPAREPAVPALTETETPAAKQTPAAVPPKNETPVVKESAAVSTKTKVPAAKQTPAAVPPKNEAPVVKESAVVSTKTKVPAAKQAIAAVPAQQPSVVPPSQGPAQTSRLSSAKPVEQSGPVSLKTVSLSSAAPAVLPKVQSESVDKRNFKHSIQPSSRTKNVQAARQDKNSEEYRSLDGAYHNALFRLFIWRDMAVEMAGENAWLGISFGKAQRSRSLEILGWAWFEWKRDGWITPHNSYLHMIYRGGIVGLVVISIIFWIIVHLLKDFIRLRSLTGGLLAGVLVYWLMISNFLVILELPYNAIPFWTLFGMTMAYAKTLKLKHAAKVSHR